MKWINVWLDDGWIGEGNQIINTPQQLQEYDRNAPEPFGLIFYGGDDIASELYNEVPTHQQVPHRMSARDFCESEIFNYALNKHIPMVGICRGAQLLHVLCGGGLTQHIEGHNYSNHGITVVTPDGNLIYTTDEQGDHHQQMIHNAGNLIGYCPADLGPEIIYHQEEKVLCIQSHPEWVEGSHFEALCQQLVKELL